MALSISPTRVINNGSILEGSMYYGDPEWLR